MADLTDTDRAIRSRGLRRTIPRAVVARALRSHPGHHAVGELKAIIDREFSEAGGMARSSVYRALEALEGVGLVHALRIGQEEVRYEWEQEAHHHLICNDCGHVDEVRLEATQNLEQEVTREHGFAVEVRHLALRGTCRTCASESPEETNQK